MTILILSAIIAVCVVVVNVILGRRYLRSRERPQLSVSPRAHERPMARKPNNNNNRELPVPQQAREQSESPAQPDDDEVASTAVALLRKLIGKTGHSHPSPDYKKFSRLRGKIICIEGLIGAGKTYLGRSMVSFFKSLGMKAVFYEEKADYKLLKQFYKDPKQYAYALQILMMRNCANNFSLAKEECKKGTICIIDRSMWGNGVFAAMHAKAGNISEADYISYLDIFNKSGPYMPDHVLLLYAPAETCHDRVVRLRKRKAEDQLPVGYLLDLERWILTQTVMHIQSHAADMAIVDWREFKDARAASEALLADKEYKIGGEPERWFASNVDDVRSAFVTLMDKGETVLA